MLSRALVNFFFWTSSSTASLSLPMRTLFAARFLRFSAASVSRTSLDRALFAARTKQKFCNEDGVQFRTCYSMLVISTEFTSHKPLVWYLKHIHFSIPKQPSNWSDSCSVFELPLDWVRSASAWSWRSCSRSRPNVGGPGSPSLVHATTTNRGWGRRGVAHGRRLHPPAAEGGRGGTTVRAIPTPRSTSLPRTAVPPGAPRRLVSTSPQRPCRLSLSAPIES
jgi:hypothetical protein